MGIPTDATATEELFSIRGPSSDVLNRVVRQSPTGKNASTEAEDVVGIRQQATTDEDTAF
jgi:hypothetical protein